MSTLSDVIRPRDATRVPHAKLVAAIGRRTGRHRARLRLFTGGLLHEYDAIAA